MFIKTYFSLITLSFGSIVSSVYADILSNDILGKDSDDQVRSIMGASHLNQHEADTSSAVTVIYYDIFKKLGIYRIDEMVRLIPGVVVTSFKDNNPVIQYHSGNPGKKRMGLKLNNHAYTVGSRYSVIWNRINPLDIKKLTIARSPSGAYFGDGSFTAEMDVETWSAEDAAVDRIGSVSYIVGSRKTQVVNITTGRQIDNKITLSGTLSRIKTDGFDFESDHETKRWDYIDNKHANLKIQYKGESNRLNVYTALSDGKSGFSERHESGTNPAGDDPDDTIFWKKIDFFIDYGHTSMANNHFGLTLDYQHYFSDQTWRSCDPAYLYHPSLGQLASINPAVGKAVAFGLPFDVNTLSQLERSYLDNYKSSMAHMGQSAYDHICYEHYNDRVTERTSGGMHYRFTLWSNLRTIFGVNGYYEYFHSENLYNGSVYSYGYNVYLQTEYKSEYYTVNFGASFETGQVFKSILQAIRGSFNWHFDGHNTMRFSWSQGYRIPDMMETRRDWGYTNMRAIGPNPFNEDEISLFYRSKNTTYLKEERIQSYEISYLSKYDNLQVDLKIFVDRLDNLLSDGLAFFQDDVTNAGRSTIGGMETKITAEFDRLTMGIIYAYMDHSANIAIEKQLAMQHSGGVYGILDANDHQSVALAYFANSAGGVEKYGRYDIVYTKDWFMKTGSVMFQTRFSHYINDSFSWDYNSDYTDDKSYLDNKNEIYATLKINY